MNTIRYAFNLPWRGVIFGVVFYGGLSGLTVHLARKISGVFFPGLLALAVVFAALGLIMVMRRLFFSQDLELTSDFILFPRGFPRTRIVNISYEDIVRMSETYSVGQKRLTLFTPKGNFEISTARLPDVESYQAVKEFLCARTSIAMAGHDNRDPGTCEGWKFFPEPVMEWVESEDLCRYRTQLVISKPPLARLARALLFFVRCLGAILAPWWFLRVMHVPVTPINGYLWLAIPATLFFTCLHWLNVTHPARATKISIRKNGITQLSGKQSRDLSYRDCSSWNVVERRYEGRELIILLLQMRSYAVEVALPDIKIRGQLLQIFRENGISRSSDLKPSWESRS